MRVDEPPTVEADARLLRRDLDNLLDNAVRHGAPPVELVTGGEQIVQGEALRVEVLDRGPGVAAADRARVFEPFFRADASRARHAGGVGLGLALCRRIAGAHGGRVEVAPRDGGGARFTLRVPG